jgi:hypothetical protein
MNPRVNLETANDPHPIEQDVSIAVGASLFRFAVIVPRYIYGKLTREDWQEAGKQLRAERDRHIRNAVMAGVYFSDEGMAMVREQVRQSMCDLLYERFKDRQIEAGNESWAVPETLQAVNA